MGPVSSRPRCACRHQAGALFLLLHWKSPMPVDLAHIRQVMAEADCLHPEAEVEAAIDAVASQINAQLAERNPVVFCVMNGGLIFAGKLAPKLNFPLDRKSTRLNSSHVKT